MIKQNLKKIFFNLDIFIHNYKNDLMVITFFLYEAFIFETISTDVVRQIFENFFSRRIQI